MLEEKDTWTFSFRIPKFIIPLMKALAYILVGGFLGVVLVKSEEKNQYDDGYNAGYEEGRDSCSEPSRLEKGFGTATKWLSRPGE